MRGILFLGDISPRRDAGWGEQFLNIFSKSSKIRGSQKDNITRMERR